jgi:hypothetical protein
MVAGALEKQEVETLETIPSRFTYLRQNVRIVSSILCRIVLPLQTDIGLQDNLKRRTKDGVLWRKQFMHGDMQIFWQTCMQEMSACESLIN